MTITEGTPIVAEAYRRPVVFAMLLHVALAVLCWMMLDGGVLARSFGVASAGFWIGVAIVLYRRPFSPSRLDLAYTQLGLVPVFALSVFVAEAML
jgi:hypothetical protein